MSDVVSSFKASWTLRCLHMAWCIIVEHLDLVHCRMGWLKSPSMVSYILVLDLNVQDAFIASYVSPGTSVHHLVF